MKLFKFVFLLSSIYMTSCIGEGDNYFTLEGANIGQYIIAHRGNWGQHGYPQNSIASLKDALRLDIYGVEFDVRQTKDSVLVINHDPTYQTIDISKSTYKELSEYNLSNGEILPTLDDFLTVYKSVKTNAKLIVEIKSCDLKLLLSTIGKYNLYEKIEFISFNREYCSALVEMGYGDKTTYLSGVITSEISPDDVSKAGYSGVSYYSEILNNHKVWISEAKELGLRIHVWTIDDLYQIKNYADMGVVVTTNVAWRCVPSS